MAAVKALQQWCKIQCNGYRDVSITNMTTSFRDGLAFCALIHKHRPDLINFDSLKKDNVYENNKLAFRVAEEELGIPALLDAEDMVALKVPDRLSILTYVSQYYNYFHGRSPIGGMAGVKRPAEATKDEPSGKKNQPVVSKVFPSSKPATDSLPPPSSQIIKPTSSPKQASRAAQKEVAAEKPRQTGTLSNKCVSCNKHVHLVQRHLVDGKLYHRNCAKSLSPSSTNAPVRELPQHTPIPKYTSHLDPIKVNTSTPTPAPSRLGPSWLATKMEKSSPPASTSSSLSTSSPSRPASVFSSPARGTQTTVFQTPTSTTTTPRTTCDPTITTTSITIRPNASPKTPRDPTFTTSITASPKATPRTSATAAKTQQAKLRFLQSGSDGTSTTEENKTPSKNLDTNTGWKVVNQGQGVRPGQAVSVVVNVAGVSRVTGGDAAKAADLGGGSGKVWTKETSSNSKTQAAAAFISKKLTEENNNNNSKPIWTNVALKKTDKPSQVEPTKKETQGVKGRVRLKVDPSILADLTTHSTMDTPKPTPTPASRTGLGARTPDKGTSMPTSALSNTPAASENSDSPADWRSRLKPVSKETKPAAPSLLPSNKPTDVSPRPWTNEAKKSQASDSTAAGLSAPHAPSSTTPVTTPASKGSLNGGSSLTANGTKPEQKISKTKPDYIPKEEILKELQQIEDNLNDLEKTGVELETRLRRSEEEGEDDSVMDELMVQWFNLIRNKQVAIRRESELVYIARTQDLEEEQPSVEQELRRLIEKPDNLKTFRDRKREEELMTKLVGIVNDRNAIVEGLDEDRLREEEEDEQLNKMMMNLDIKKDKPKKKSPMSKLFNWGNKKDT